MNRLGLLLCAMLFCAGCASDGDQGSWDEVWKDLRGDNMQMRNDFSTGDRPVPARLRD
jgi:hypothetical protein